MNLTRNLAVGLVLAGALAFASPAEARHRHSSSCGHRSYHSDRYDRRDYRYDRRNYRHDRRDYRYDRRYDYRYDYGYDYGYRYRRSYPPVRYHYHGRSRCSRSHVGIYFGF